MTINKDSLKQYRDAAARMKELQTVVDSLKDGPDPEKLQKNEFIPANIELFEKEVKELLEMTHTIEVYIQNLNDNRMRRVLTMRYMLGFTWVQIAFRIGGPATADAVRMEHNRFLKKQNNRT